MTRMIVSLIFNIAYSVVLFIDSQFNILLIICLLLCLIQLIGILLLKLDFRKPAIIIYGIGIFAFVPLGFIGISGMRKYLAENSDEY